MKEKEVYRKMRMLAIIMTICGIFLWFFADSDKPVIQDLVGGVGILLFFVGAANVNRTKPLAELSKREKRTKLFLLIIFSALLLAGIYFQ